MIIFYIIFYLVIIGSTLLLYQFDFLAKETVRTLVGSITGAFLGFTGFIFQDMYTKTRKRIKENYDSLVFIERTLVQNIESIKANITLVRNTQKILRENFTIFTVREIAFDTTISDNLTNVDLLNDLRLYFVTLSRFQHESKYAEEMYKAMYSHYSSGKDWAGLQTQLSGAFNQMLEILLNTLKILLDDSVDILSKVRILLIVKKYSLFTKAERYTVKVELESNFEKENIKNEIRYGQYS